MRFSLLNSVAWMPRTLCSMADSPDMGGAMPGGGEGAPAGDAGGSQAPADGAQSDAAPSDGSLALSDDVMYGDLDQIEEPVAEPPTPEQDPQTPPAAKPAAAPPEKPPVAPPAAPKPGEAAAPATDQRGPSTGQPTRQGPEQLLTSLLQNRDEIVKGLATQRFQLSQADTDAMETDAIGHLPQLMARVYYEAVTSALNAINQHVPHMVDSRVAQSAEARKAEDTFYSEWPNIDRTKYDGDVTRMATLFRQQNPNAALADVIKWTGAAVSAIYGLPPPGKAAPGAQNGRSQQPGRRTPPFAPAQGGRPAMVPVNSQTDPWSGMGLTADE